MAMLWIILSLFVWIQIVTGAVVNVALGKPVDMSSKRGNIDPAIAVNGDTTAVHPCCIIHTALGRTTAWWYVDLQTQVQDATVKIYFRTDFKGRRNGVMLYISTIQFTNPPSSEVCHTVTGRADGTDIPNVVSVNCAGIWRYLMVYTQTDNDGQGAVLDFGEVQVLVCDDNTYGVDCDKSCNSRQCAQAPLSCNRYTGACPAGGCTAGWMGNDCAQACSAGTYGTNCDKSCSSHQCAVTTCDRYTGTCPSGCKAGFKGTYCTQVCSIGTYGMNCDKSCSSRQCAVTQTSCDRYTGVCPAGGCKAGWRGTDCTQVCSTGTYGTNCAQLCSSRQCAVTPTSCDRSTGACPAGGCKAGWRGTDCTQVCSDGTYGTNCNKSCISRQCAMTTTSCDRFTGACPAGGCKAGWRGTDCTQECSDGTYGTNCDKSCSSRQCAVIPTSCDRSTGACPAGGCKAGWRGTDCTQVCSDGTYGTNCNKSCISRQCAVTTTSCDRYTGACPAGGCLTGWIETDCSQVCPNGAYGSNCNSTCGNCAGGKTCNHVTGNCTGGCGRGWKGTLCKQMCSNGTYGPGCNSICGQCIGNASCNVMTGRCAEGCQAGFKGNQCKETCNNRTYGVNCNEACGQCNGGNCDRLTGHCPSGCLSGYGGHLCQAVQGPDEPGSDVLAPAVAGAVAAVLVILIIVIIIVVYRRRKRASDSRKSTAESHAELNDGNVYVNLTLHEEAVDGKNQKPTKRTEKLTNQAAPETKQSETKVSEGVEQEEEMVDEEETTNRDYYNDSEDAIREVHVSELENTVSKIKLREGGFEAEYSRLPTGFTAPYSDSQKPENAGKNKFKGYYPYDHNRVRLSLLPDIPGSDYINASIMHSYDKSKTYIASQAPNKKTVGDFWRMIWEQRCGRIIMLTGLVEDRKVKCYQYWPEKGSLETDHFLVDVETTDTRANYTVRKIKVSSKDSHESRSVVQYHYTSWPDHGVPDTHALVNFIWMIRRTETQSDGPLLVHCSAGIGRTGTYIAVDSLLDQARKEGIVDVSGYVSVMRGQRKNMIQTKDQYECVFQCLVEMTRFGDTSMDVETFNESYISSGMDCIVDLKTLRELTKMLITEERKDAASSHQMWVDGNQDFIVRVGPTMRKLHGHLMVETPSPGMVKLLWKLVDENGVHNVVIISKTQVELHGKLGSTDKYGGVSLKTKNQTILTPDLSKVTLQIQTKNDDSPHNVSLYRFGGSPTVDSMSSSLQSSLQDLSSGTSPVVVIHDNPDRKCAVLFCIMSNILSGIVEDNRVDVIGHVRTFLKCCPDLHFTEDEVERLLEFAQRCVQMTTNSNTYANL